MHGNQDEQAIAASANRKISLRLLPLLFLSYLIAYIDRTNISFASVQMNADLGFSAAVYGLGAGLFFAGYSLFEIPSNLMSERHGARRWLARIMATWGLISAAMIFVETPMQFYVMRFLLGVAEAGFYPAVMLYMSSWFPAAWFGRAVSRFYIAGPMGTVIMGSLAGLLLGFDGMLGLRGWQWMLLVEAVPAILMAAVLLRLLPDAPATSRWLSAAEKDWLARQLAADVTASGAQHHDFWRTFTHPVVLGIGGVLAFTFACNSAVIFSGPKLLMAATGWTIGEAGFAIALGGLFTATVMVLVGWHSDLRRERHRHIAALLAAAIAAAVMMALASGQSAALAPLLIIAGYVLFVTATAVVGTLGSPTAALSLHPGSRAIGFAAINTIAQVGNFLGPILWGLAASRTGSFDAALAVIPFVLLLPLALILVLRRGAIRQGTAFSPA